MVVCCLIFVSRAHARVWDVEARYYWGVASALGENRLAVPETFCFVWIAFGLGIGRLVVSVRCGWRTRASLQRRRGRPILGYAAASPGSRGRRRCI